VGDRYVVEAMKDKNINLGGEQSGHIILSDYATTGDGLLAAIQILRVLCEEKVKISQLCSVFQTVPQHLENIRLNGSVSASNVMKNSDVIHAIDAASTMLNGYGRVLVRPSGTEPLIRVMAEGDNENDVKKVISNIAQAIKKIA
jgi:phosphoglucosamine mutase